MAMMSNLDNRKRWVTLCNEWKSSWQEEIDPSSDGINIYSFVDKLNEEMQDDWYTVTAIS